ncbi:alpha/beta hydrolase [Desulfobacter hydrogenophilus]|uniref:Alpha/beta fold hydrolase n=1 Tax=Desulfobacter hydrogenophilus TaxID=2291 RepID=A0A328FAM8_9BACT|nr:alpha/beta fold hydrolase [Desulfobacter hydrogenophilus]NDY72615.1 alpha/beta fold hydrolase [Desulfobacter hydrogenophilus]QBH13334.1 alpha/beta fold hydrolase [Desulfobacter hydrogenophilus]RAM01266.1 alpha/beta hydrolase [Desulfobacter hydrogenophilus]
MQTELNGIQLAYDEVGEGPAVLLIHGFPLCRQMWRPQMQALAAAGFRAVVPDLRGFGESEPGTEVGSTDLLADDLIVLLDHLGIEKAVVGGMSMGGYVMLNLLARYPERFSAACFIVTRADADDETARGKRNHLIAEVKAGRPDVVATAFTPLLFADQTVAERPELVDEVRGWMAAASPSGLVVGLEAIRDRSDSSALLPQLKIPALIMGAHEDKAIPPEKSTGMAEQIPGAQLCMVAAAGHMVNIEQPDAFNSALLDFLRDN